MCRDGPDAGATASGDASATARPRPPICSPGRDSTPRRPRRSPTRPTARPARSTTTSAARKACSSPCSSSGSARRSSTSPSASRSAPDLDGRLGELWRGIIRHDAETGDAWLLLEFELWLHAARDPEVGVVGAERFAAMRSGLATALTGGPPSSASSCRRPPRSSRCRSSRCCSAPRSNTASTPRPCPSDARRRLRPLLRPPSRI